MYTKNNTNIGAFEALFLIIIGVAILAFLLLLAKEGLSQEQPPKINWEGCEHSIGKHIKRYIEEDYSPTLKLNTCEVMQKRMCGFPVEGINLTTGEFVDGCEYITPRPFVIRATFVAFDDVHYFVERSDFGKDITFKEIKGY